MSTKIYDEIVNMHVLDTHEHTYPHQIMISKGPSIIDILEGSYIFWIAKVPKKDDYESLVKNIKEISGSTFFKACSIAIKDIYGVSIDPPTVKTLKEASRLVYEAYRNQNWIKKIFREKALIDKALLDPYWDVYGKNFDIELFSPVFRTNMFLFGYSKEAKDRDGNNPYLLEKYFGLNVETFDDYLELINKALEDSKRRGYVALKFSIAYERSILFENVSREEAKKVFDKRGFKITSQDIKLFGDFIVHYILDKAGEMEFPVQFHTGLAIIEGSNPMNLVNLLRKYHNVNFIFFHGGYPWIRETIALAFTFPNLYIDLCWLPIISPSACKTVLREIIELGLSSRTMWGGDCWVAEATYGALKFFKKFLSEVLQGMVKNKYLKNDEALEIAQRILMENALKLFNIN
jgi:predicted TIM-barrel fold metal-dependent hydrolase